MKKFKILKEPVSLGTSFGGFLVLCLTFCWAVYTSSGVLLRNRLQDVPQSHFSHLGTSVPVGVLYCKALEGLLLGVSRHLHYWNTLEGFWWAPGNAWLWQPSTRVLLQHWRFSLLTRPMRVSSPTLLGGWLTPAVCLTTLCVPGGGQRTPTRHQPWPPDTAQEPGVCVCTRVGCGDGKQASVGRGWLWCGCARRGCSCSTCARGASTQPPAPVFPRESRIPEDSYARMSQWPGVPAASSSPFPEVPSGCTHMTGPAGKQNLCLLDNTHAWHRSSCQGMMFIRHVPGISWVARCLEAGSMPWVPGKEPRTSQQTQRGAERRGQHRPPGHMEGSQLWIRGARQPRGEHGSHVKPKPDLGGGESLGFGLRGRRCRGDGMLPKQEKQFETAVFARRCWHPWVCLGMLWPWVQPAAGHGDLQGRRRGRVGGSGSDSSLPSVAGLYFKARFREKAGFREAAGERETCFGVTSHADKAGKGWPDGQPVLLQKGITLGCRRVGGSPPRMGSGHPAMLWAAQSFAPGTETEPRPPAPSLLEGSQASSFIFREQRWLCAHQKEIPVCDFFFFPAQNLTRGLMTNASRISGLLLPPAVSRPDAFLLLLYGRLPWLLPFGDWLAGRESKKSYRAMSAQLIYK